MKIFKAVKMYNKDSNFYIQINYDFLKVELIGDVDVNGINEYYWRVLDKVTFSKDWELITENEGIVDYLVLVNES